MCPPIASVDYNEKCPFSSSFSSTRPRDFSACNMNVNPGSHDDHIQQYSPMHTRLVRPSAFYMAIESRESYQDSCCPDPNKLETTTKPVPYLKSAPANNRTDFSIAAKNEKPEAENDLYERVANTKRKRRTLPSHAILLLPVSSKC